MYVINPDIDIQAISIKFADSIDETIDASKIAQTFDAEHHIVYVENYLSELPKVTRNEVSLLPVIPNPGKIFCVGLNYENHRVETKRPESQKPTIFTRFADSQTAHDDNIICPKVSDKFNHDLTWKQDFRMRKQ